jgi:hypothetical protein
MTKVRKPRYWHPWRWYLLALAIVWVLVIWGLVALTQRAHAYDNVELKASMMRGEAFEYWWHKRVTRDPNDGIASFYTDHQTASGENLKPWDTTHLTCSHPDPKELGQMLRVRYRDKCIVCRVTDVGPDEKLRRAIDLTPAEFKLLGLRTVEGLAYVKIDRHETCP